MQDQLVCRQEIKKDQLRFKVLYAYIQGWWICPLVLHNIKYSYYYYNQNLKLHDVIFSPVSPRKKNSGISDNLITFSRPSFATVAIVMTIKAPMSLNRQKRIGSAEFLAANNRTTTP